MTSEQLKAWKSYKTNYEWRHQSMGASVWVCCANIEYLVDGYLFVVSNCGDVVWLRTSDGKMRQVMEIERPREVWKREVDLSTSDKS